MQETITLLEKKIRDLSQNISAKWHFPAKLPKNPLSAKYQESWPVFGKDANPPKDANGNYWFYGTMTFPESIAGIALKGKEARFFINGMLPFTLWIDGEEIFKETHTWMATGPIADPFPMQIEPGRVHNLIMKIEPIHVPLGLGLSHHVRPQICIEIALDLDVAIAQLRYAEKLAETPAEKRLIEKAAQQIDRKALEANQWEKALYSIARMEKTLQPLSKKAKEVVLHLLGHTHIDMDWQWTWKDTVHCIRRDAKAVTDMMDDHPEVTLTHSQVATYEVVRQMDPDVFKKIKQRTAEGRWENAAGTWVEGDLNMADGESIARHFLYAADWTKEHLDSKAKVLWEPDTFGHPGNMPQLAKLAEFNAYFHTRCNPGGEHEMWPIRKWTGIDGTSITTFSNWYGSYMDPRSLLRDVFWCRKAGRKVAFHVWGIGDHGGALSRFKLALFERFRNKPIMPRFQFSTIQKMLEAVESAKEKLPENKGETHTIFEGCYTTTSNIKKYNRHCENALLMAEALSAMAGLDRRDKVREAWQPVLFNQFHDIFDGCSIPAAYEDAYRRAEKSLKSARQVIDESVGKLIKVAKKGNSITIINPLGFGRTEPVAVALPAGAKCLMDESGAVIPIQKKGKEFLFIAHDVPALSQKTYKIMTSLPKKVELPGITVKQVNFGAAFDLNPDPNSLGYFDVDTPQARILINRNSGAIGSYFDKRLGRELVNYGVPRPVQHAATARLDLALNVFQVIDEAPNGMAAWLINRIQREENLVDGAEVTQAENGPVYARFHVVHKFRSSRIEEDIFIYRDYPRVDFEATIDWREKGSGTTTIPQLKVAFTTSMRAPRLRTEGPFIIRELPADGQEVPTQKWADLSGDEFGFAIYNDSKYGCDALGSRMRLSLLRNTYTPSPDSDNGVHSFRFSFEPHAAGISNGELTRNGMAFNRPCVGAVSQSKISGGSSPVAVGGADSVVCTAFRKAEHGDGLLVRFFETSGKACSVDLTFGGSVKSVQEVNLLENSIGSAIPVKKGKSSAKFRAFEVKTLLFK